MIRGVILAVTLGAGVFGAADAHRPYTLEGSVVDRVLRTPVPGAQVALLAARRSVTTSEDGVFDFGARPLQGPDQLVITHPDYQTVRIPLGDLGTESWILEVTMIPTDGSGAGRAQHSDETR